MYVGCILAPSLLTVQIFDTMEVHVSGGKDFSLRFLFLRRLLEDLEEVQTDKVSMEYLLREKLERLVQSEIEARVARMHQVRHATLLQVLLLVLLLLLLFYSQ